MHVQCTCLVCGEPFLARARSLRRGWGKYCSTACFHVARRSCVERVCPSCGSTFLVKPAVAKIGKGLYCRRLCATLSRRIPFVERFWRRTDKNGPVPSHRPDLGPCWLWTGARSPKGYGVFNDQETGHRAHRWSWQITHGEIPDGLFVCHACDNPTCVRPEHLFLGTPAENSADRDAKGRQDPGRGVAQPGARLTDDDVRTIRALRAAGVMQRTIAAQFDVAESVISEIVRRKAWRHVE